MTEQKYPPKLELKINIPCTFTLIKAQPQTGEGQYGKWFRYDIREGSEEKSYFASEYVHDILQKKNPFDGMIVTITKKEKEEGKGFWYEVFTENDQSRPLAEPEFVQSLEDMNAPSSKDEIITRTAIVKSLIESGKNVPTPDFFADARKFIEYCATGKVMGLGEDITDEDIAEVDREIPF